MKHTLTGRVAVVAGASRGAGKGIALALGEAGATVYVAARTSRNGPPPADGAPGTIEDTADEIARRGGVGIPVRADCANATDVAALFARVERDHGRVDVAANAVWGMADALPTMDAFMASWRRPFWEQPDRLWEATMAAGPQAYYLVTVHAARSMAKHGGGLIVGVTDGFTGAPATTPSDAMGSAQLLWHLSHQCINLLMRGIANEGRKHKIAAVTLMPGFMRTERVTRLLTTDALNQQFGFEKSESTEYVGRAVVGLATDTAVKKKSGSICFVADLAEEYGFTDVDGRRVPRH
jgi:NAD(P)-dependent dehydrogenase (short-subunit alcohol dehydrogenase family)